MVCEYCFCISPWKLCAMPDASVACVLMVTLPTLRLLLELVVLLSGDWFVSGNLTGSYGCQKS